MGEIRRTVRVFGYLLRTQVLIELQYRANLFFQIFQSCVAVCTTLVAIGVVYGQVNELNGWTHPQMLALFGIYFIGSGLLRAFISPNLAMLVADITGGKLDYVLLKPVDAQVLVSTRAVGIWPLIDVGVGTCVLGWAMGQLDGPVGIAQVALFLVSLALGMYIIYCFMFMLITTAFWFIRVETIMELYDSVYIAARWPLSMYPKWLRFTLTFVIPISFVAFTPAEAITGRLGGTSVLLEVVVAAVFTVAARWLFTTALRRYTSSSA